MYAPFELPAFSTASALSICALGASTQSFLLPETVLKNGATSSDAKLSTR
jgi:hypothetical protein